MKPILLILALAACEPRLPPVSHCTPYVNACIGGRPMVCSGDQRWEPSGDLPCSAVAAGAVCVMLPDGRAGCGIASDGGAR